MGILKYEASNIRWGGEIKKVEIERETEASIWIKGRRLAKVSDWVAYFDTFAQAKAHIINITTGIYHKAKEKAEYTENNMMKSIALTEQDTGV